MRSSLFSCGLRSGKLDPNNSYTSNWLGDPRGGNPGKRSGDGKIVVGLHGRSNGREINSLGLVVRGVISAQARVRARTDPHSAAVQGPRLYGPRYGRCFFKERVAVADDRLGDELVTHGRDAGMLADGGADRHHLDQARADLVDENLDANDPIGLQLLGFKADVVQAVFAGIVDQTGDFVDLTPGKRTEKAS